MLNFILILFDRKVIYEHTSEVVYFILKNRASNITVLLITTISLIIWFGCGLLSAFWVKKDLKKRNLEKLSMFFLILFTSFIGFIIYIITTRGELEISENEVDFSEIEETIEFEKEEEFHDEIEEVIEEEVESIIDNILENNKIEKN